MAIPATRKKFVPEEIDQKKVNNYLFFSYPYMLLWREESNAWFPLPIDRMSEEEIDNIRKFVQNKYLLMNTKNLSLVELAEDLGVYLKGLVSKEHLDLLKEYVSSATFGQG